MQSSLTMLGVFQKNIVENHQIWQNKQ